MYEPSVASMRSCSSVNAFGSVLSKSKTPISRSPISSGITSSDRTTTSVSICTKRGSLSVSATRIARRSLADVPVIPWCSGKRKRVGIASPYRKPKILSRS
jgi:hypothetical protein